MIDAVWWHRFNARLWLYRAESVFNPWGQCDPMDVSALCVNTRRLNLETHFERDARYLLIGEAPGYRGCHFSGVPFTSESQFPYRITSRPQPWRESSATVVHAALKSLGIAPATVMWNAFPFHPFKPFTPLSNRAPTLKEVQDTTDILHMVIDRFPKARVIAVGQQARRALGFWGVDATVVRHPSMGGATEFYKQLKAML